MPTPDQQPDDTPLSRTQRKHEVEALQTLGRALTELARDQLKRIPMPDDLRNAVLDWHRFPKHEAQRRQLQYIGRLMRKIDPTPIAEALAHVRGESTAAKAHFHSLERWRERLLTDPDGLTAWMAEHPASDAQQLRSLIRNASREAAQGKPPKSSRELFRHLRETLEHPLDTTDKTNLEADDLSALDDAA
jgi:ribosome-associated protein